MWWLATAHAGTVCGDPYLCDHTTIAEGLLAYDYNLDLVGPGPFLGPLTVGASAYVTITGDPSEVSVIDPAFVDISVQGPNASLTLASLTVQGQPYEWFVSCDQGAVTLTDVAVRGYGYGYGGVRGTGCSVQVTGGELSQLGGAVDLVGGSIATSGGTWWSGNGAFDGGAIRVTDADVDLHDDLFEANYAGGDGGAIRAIGTSTVSATGVTFRGNYAYGYGGAVGDGGAISQVSADNDGSLMLDTVEWDGNWATGSGGVVWVSGAAFVQVLESGWGSAGDNHAALGGGAVFIEDGDSVTITHSRFVRDRADRSGGAVAVTGGDGVAIVESEFVDTSAGTGGGALWLLDSSGIRIRDNVFDGTHADVNGGAVAAEGSTDVSVLRNRFCWTAAQEGGGVWASGTSAELSNDGFVGVAASIGGAVAAESSSVVVVTHATVTEASAPSGWLAYTDETSSASVDRTLTGPPSAPTPAIIGDVTVDATNFEADPIPAGGLRGTAIWLGSSLPADLVCGRELRQHPDSAFVATDADDYGMFGGPDADAPNPLSDATADHDGDGAGWRYDCDDDDAEGDVVVNGFEPELCDDELDNDCDGVTDPPGQYQDLDGDGYGSGTPWCDDALAPKETEGVEVGGDCDDGDSTVHPGAVDVCGDDFDQDCSGRDARCGREAVSSLVGGQCGCASPGGPGVFGVVGLVGLVGRRRRPPPEEQRQAGSAPSPRYLTVWVPFHRQRCLPWNVLCGSYAPRG